MIARIAFARMGITLFAMGTAMQAVAQTAPAAQDSDVLAKYDSNWMPSLALGVQFLPDYDENGRSAGLNKQQFFGLMTVDGLFKDLKGKYAPYGFHTGVTLAMLGTPVKRADKPSLPKEFNDISNSIVANGYFYVPMKQSPDQVHNLGPLIRLGAISRDTLGNHGDSVNWVASVGAQYTYESFWTARDSQGHAPLNGAPAGYFRLSAAKYEDYAGLGSKMRLVGDAAFQVYPKMNMYFGVQGNFGGGPDEFMIVVSMLRKPEELANVFSLGK